MNPIKKSESLPSVNDTAAVCEETPPPESGKFPCPCCGYKTLPVPKEEAIAYICPVCFWENDVFTPEEDQASDENHGMTLLEGRKVYKKLGAIREDFLQYVRKPLPEERA